MPGSAASVALAAAVAVLPLVSAHGYVASATISGTPYFVGNPNWAYQTPIPKQPGWYANNLDNGFVSPSSYDGPDIICHKNATPGSTALTINAGGTISIQWNTWPDSHKGPVSNMLAAVSGDFSAIDKTSLKWFEAEVGALLDDSTPPGTWVTDKLIANNFTSDFIVPAGLAPGNYVLRHEILALHAAGSSNGAQSYPMCINLVVTGSGSTSPCASGADCRLGEALYTATDPGVLIDIYSPITDYQIPGPALISGGDFTGNIGGPPGGSGGSSGSAPSSVTSKPATSAPATSATSKATTLVTSTKAPTSVAPTSTSKATTPTSSAAPTGSCAAKYAQCGGQGWTGATCCVAGSKCVASGQYYSQCQ